MPLIMLLFFNQGILYTNFTLLVLVNTLINVSKFLQNSAITKRILQISLQHTLPTFLKPLNCLFVPTTFGICLTNIYETAKIIGTFI